MKSKDQILLEEAYNFIQLQKEFLTEGFTSQVLEWAMSLFQKKFPNVSKAAEQALQEYEKNKDLNSAADIIAKALAADSDTQKPSDNVQESLKDTFDKGKKFVQQGIEKGLDAAKPYAQAALGIMSSPQDLIKVLNPKTFLEMLKTLSADYAHNLSNTVKRGTEGDLGIREYAAASNPATAAITAGKTVAIYNLLLHGLKRYEEKFGKSEDKEYFKQQRGDFKREARNVNPSVLAGPTPKQIGSFAGKALDSFSKISGDAFGKNAEYHAG